EVVHVLRNQILLQFAQSSVLLHEGDTMTLPGREPHSWVNPADEESEVVWTLVPAAWSGSS
ncbi:MAG: helix-turn-helix protein, partial [Frondihabitans sp.]|nr:helix-turn-helix protein [Frondihabitans sp.]